MPSTELSGLNVLTIFMLACPVVSLSVIYSFLHGADTNIGVAMRLTHVFGQHPWNVERTEGPLPLPYPGPRQAARGAGDGGLRKTDQTGDIRGKKVESVLVHRFPNNGGVV